MENKTYGARGKVDERDGAVIGEQGLLDVGHNADHGWAGLSTWLL